MNSKKVKIQNSLKKLAKYNLALIFFIISCNLNDGLNQSDIPKLEEIASFRLGIPEPSGLCLDNNQNTLWVVSDQTGKIYKITMDGRLLKSLAFEGMDLEGVCRSAADGSLWVVEERSREIVQIDSNGIVLQRQKVAVENRDENNGLEGITISSDNHLWVINEKNPVRLVQIYPDLNKFSGYDPKLASDLSGICAAEENLLWLLSDEERKLFLWHTEKGKIAEYIVPVINAEGIAVSEALDRIFIVSDSQEKLYEFLLPAEIK